MRSFLLLFLCLTSLLNFGQQGITIIKSGENSHIGSDVAITDLYAASSHADNAAAIGIVFTFENENGNWNPSDTIIASDSKVGNAFGECIEIFENQMMVGAPSIDDWSSASERSGKVYYFEYENAHWVENQILEPPAGFELSKFGQSLYFNEDYLLVGAPAKQFNLGSAILYKNIDEEWVQSQVFNNEDLEIDRFGETVFVNEKWLGISGFKSNDNNIPHKIVRLYEMVDDEWIPAHEIIEDESITNIAIPAQNLQSFEIYNDEIIIGYRIPASSIFNVPSRGGVFAYTFDGEMWNKSHKFSHWGFEEIDLGNCISFNKDFMIFGASKNNETSFDIDNTILIYSKNEINEWNQHPILDLEVEVVDGNALGFKSDISSNYAIFGAPVGIGHSGIVYIVDLSEQSISSFNITPNVNFNIFPNPSIDYINLETDWIHFYAKIFDPNGKELKIVFDDKKIDISNFKPGIYYLFMQDLNSKESGTFKFIKL